MFFALATFTQVGHAETLAGPGSVRDMSAELTRWRLNLADDSTITFDEATKTITKIKTGDTCYLGEYVSFAIEDGTLVVRSGHAPKLGKWYVPG